MRIRFQPCLAEVWTRLVVSTELNAAASAPHRLDRRNNGSTGWQRSSTGEWEALDQRGKTLAHR